MLSAALIASALRRLGRRAAPNLRHTNRRIRHAAIVEALVERDSVAGFRALELQPGIGPPTARSVIDRLSVQRSSPAEATMQSGSLAVPAEHVLFRFSLSALSSCVFHIRRFGYSTALARRRLLPQPIKRVDNRADGPVKPGGPTQSQHHRWYEIRTRSASRPL